MLTSVTLNHVCRLSVDRYDQKQRKRNSVLHFLFVSLSAKFSNFEVFFEVQISSLLVEVVPQMIFRGLKGSWVKAFRSDLQPFRGLEENGDISVKPTFLVLERRFCLRILRVAQIDATSNFLNNGISWAQVVAVMPCKRFFVVKN